jgi:hypothetical protein
MSLGWWAFSPDYVDTIGYIWVQRRRQRRQRHIVRVLDGACQIHISHSNQLFYDLSNGLSIAQAVSKELEEEDTHLAAPKSAPLGFRCGVLLANVFERGRNRESISLFPRDTSLNITRWLRVVYALLLLVQAFLALVGSCPHKNLGCGTGA